jgi:hypothetical protein
MRQLNHKVNRTKENPMASVAEMEAQVKGEFAPQVAQVKAVLRLVAAKESVPSDLLTAARVMQRIEYIRWSSRAGRFMFTPKGQTFHKQMRRFG